MKTYLEDKKLYVQNDDKLIYEVSYFETYDGYTSMTYTLNLICGVDYVDADTSDIQGYVSANRFIEEVQTEQVVQYFLEEGLKDCLKENGYTILDKLPKIHK